MFGKTTSLCLVPVLLFLGACTIPLRSGAGIRLSVQMVPASEMASAIPQSQDKMAALVEALLQIYITSMDPLAGAILEQLIFGPLRDNRRDRTEARKTQEKETQ